MNHLLYDTNGRLSYSDDYNESWELIDKKKCHHCEGEFDKLSINYFCDKCQSECNKVDWEETMDIIIRSI